MIRPASLREIEINYANQLALDEIDNWQESIQKALQEINASFPFSKVLTKASKGQVLEIKELIQIFHIVKALGPLQKQIKLDSLEFFDINQVNKFFKIYFKESEQLFDFKSEDLVTYKHPKLRNLDKKINETNKELRLKLSKISQKWSSDQLLQQNEYDILEDKFVLPIRSDRFTSSLGRIIYRSNTGNTLFVEPFALRELTNQIEELKAELEREIYKLLKFLSDEVHKNIIILTKIFNHIKEIDLTFGRLRCAYSFSLCRPQINQNKEYKIEGIFHPLISDPIKNDLIIKEEDRGLLISGPNTGGKTVLLKSFCLCLILPHLGFYVPASSADINLTGNIFFISHDNQSLMDGLSSFSSEALNYLKMLANIDETSVVFIDEIFNTTSSLEASELGTALIKELTHIGAQVFISSHHENLKEWIFEEGLIKSGHMGFTKGSNRPTYIFHLGSPGKSFAKEVFLGLEREVLNSPVVSRWLAAKDIAGPDLDKRIQDLDQIREESLSQKEKYESLLREISKEKEQTKNLLEIEKQKLESLYEKRWQKLKKETLDLQEKVKRGDVKNILKVAESLSKAKKDYGLKGSDEKAVQGFEKKDFIIGDLVVIKGLNKEGKIIKINKAKAQVESGKIKTWVALKDLLGSHNKLGSEKGSSERVQVHINKNQTNRGMIFDARGMRREVFLNQAEGHILDVLNGDLPFVDVIHGFGDGILKRSLYELLKQYDGLQYDFIEGNMGTTRIELVN